MLLISREANGKDAIPETIYLLGGSTGKEEPLQVGGVARKKIIDDTLHGSDLGTESVIFIECTPLCDFSQNKRRLPLLIAGVLLNLKLANELPIRADFLRQVGPLSVLIPTSPDPCMVVLNSHFVTGVTQTELEKLTVIGRLRSAVLSDVASWLGRQIARPGYVSI